MAGRGAGNESSFREIPQGFPYEEVIKVLDGSALRLPGTDEPIVVRADYPGNECGHMATLTIETQKMLLASDLIYNGVHAWCGSGVDRPAIDAWISIPSAMKASTTSDWSFFAGHGQRGAHEIIDNMSTYLRAFLDVTATADTQQAAIDAMKASFPGFAQDDFLSRAQRCVSCRRVLIWASHCVKRWGVRWNATRLPRGVRRALLSHR